MKLKKNNNKTSKFPTHKNLKANTATKLLKEKILM